MKPKLLFLALFILIVPLFTTAQTDSSMKEFNDKLIELVKRWQIDPNLLPPLIK